MKISLKTICITPLLLVTALTTCSKDYFAIMAVTGATPLALAEKVPEGITLKIDGLTKRDYEFSGSALRALATTRIRTREIAPDGEFLGCYIYNGIPLYNILEGIAPKEDKTAVFDRPLDMVVTFISSSGKKAYFGYGELTMADDRVPVTLAYHRKELLPTKDPEKYTKNKFKGSIKGLKLICPAEPDTARYLDDVVHITLTRLNTPDEILPKMKKGKKCSSDTLMCVEGGKAVNAVFAGVKKDREDRWVRVGHGRGYKGIGKAEGYRLDSFVMKNFPDFSDRDFIIFVACDGYRSIFSGREILKTEAGQSFLILDNNMKSKKKNYMAAPVDDFFVDRNVWGLTHIVHVKM